MEKQRLDRFISNQTGVSRSEARELLKKQLVTVNGIMTKDYGTLILPEKDIITCNGVEVEYKKYIYILMNKPSGILSASNDRTRQTVVDLVPEHLRRNGLFPVGRLDKDTTGMLMITDDGVFAHDIISPKKKISKCYFVSLDGVVTEDMCEKFKAGVTLADGSVCRPAILIPLENNNARLILCEGKYHEVKRMFGTVGLGVVKLHRESIGELELPEDLEEGKCIEMTKNMLKKVKNCGRYAF